MYEKEVADILDEAFTPQGFTVTTKEKDARRKQDARYCNDKAKTMFGEFLPIKEGLITMV